MSLILSLETATRVCSVALHEKGQLLSVESIKEDYSHFEKLPQLIQKVFKTSRKKLAEINAIAISRGPGSYTGLRIGTSMAKGIAFAINVPLIAVNTLEAMAYSLSNSVESKDLLCPMIDARRQEVYCMIVDKELNISWPVQALVVSETSFDEVLQNNNLVLFGDGSTKFKTLFKNNEGIRFEEVEPNATAIGELAWKKFQSQEFEDTAYFEPFYLKDFKPGLSKKKLTL